MNAKKLTCTILALLLLFSMSLQALASGGYYLPDVRGEMSSPSYWTDDKECLMTYEEIEELNKKTISTKGTNMYDLKNQPETVDGIALNEALMKSGAADSGYYLGWTYLGSKEKATQEDYDKIIENTQNPNAEKEQKVLYAVATERTELRTFPSDTPIWDDPNDFDFDYQYLVGIRVNEPLVITSVSKDGNFYLAKNICCSGWVDASTVAICEDKDQWLSAWDIPSENALVVWGDKVYTETSLMGVETSQLMLTMGTVLKIEKNIDPNELIDNRAAYNSYAVYIPLRNSDGTYSEKLTLISEHKKVSSGFLPLTQENISKVVFSALGNTYGWGGSLNSDDCSGYMRNVYKCFGLELARNTTWQTVMPMAKIDMKYMAKEERIKFLEAIPFGTILYFSGHEMMFLGAEDGKYYVISTVSTIMHPEKPSVRQRIRSTIVNTLEVKRANGNTWLDELTVALVPFLDAEKNNLPPYEWYHEGVEFCLKNNVMGKTEDKFFNLSGNVTWEDFFKILLDMEENPSEADAFLWAKENNLICESDLDKAPLDAMTREQLVSSVYLYAQFKGYDVSSGEDTNILSYDDAFLISEPRFSAMQFAVAEGIISGKTETTLNPSDLTTRAELAVIIERLEQYKIRTEKAD